MPVERARAVLDAALRAGADDAEVYLIDGAVRRVTVHAGQWSESDGRQSDLALRVWCAGRQALLTADSGEPRALAEAAVAQARAVGVPGKAVLRSGSAPDERVVSTLDNALAIVRVTADAVAARPLPETHVVSIGYEGRSALRVLVNSRGLVAASPVTAHQLWCWWEGAGGHVRLAASGSDPADLAPHALADDLAEQAACLTAAAWTDELGDRPVVLAPNAAADIARVFGRLLCAQHVLGRLGRLRERVGHRIASTALSLVDDGMWAGRAFDDEGTPTETTTLIENGRLRAFLHTIETAERLGAMPNGKAERASLWHAPAAAPSTVYIPAGAVSPEALRERLGDGLAIEGLLRSGRVQSTTGRFTAVGYGWRLRGGRPVERVTGVPLSAGVFELLRDIEERADDLRFVPLADGAGSPSLLVSRMRVG